MDEFTLLWKTKRPEVTAALAVMAVLTIFEAPFAYRVGGFPPPWGILLVSDGLSSLMLVIINVISFLAIIYSIKYMTMYTAKPKYYSLFLLMLTGWLIACLVVLGMAEGLLMVFFAKL
jgi:formate hydrogenlyase subunit 3/multisubunit Na+/H+ antiporter MnhD subunit